jgi:ectoine hydroxylase
MRLFHPLIGHNVVAGYVIFTQQSAVEIERRGTSLAMRIHDILSNPSSVLSDNDRRTFFERGYLRLPAFIPQQPLHAAQRATDAAIERSRHLNAPHSDFSFEPQHSTETPKPSRLFRAADENVAFWQIASSALMLDLAADLVGPDVRYRETYINFKSPGTGAPVDWHQDFAFFPHTNRAIITAITYLVDVSVEMGPLMVVPGSHHKDVFDHYDSDGVFNGKVQDSDLSSASIQQAIDLPGPAGTVVVFDGCMLHGSKPNLGSSTRPALVSGYSAADAFPYTELPPPHIDSHAWSILRGERPLYAHHEPVHVKVPPSWTGGQFKPIFDLQQTD